MVIDIHQHITFRNYPQFSRMKGHGPFTADDLLKDMDKWGIEQSVVLPLANPENTDIYGVAGCLEVITECRKHLRLLPFCNIDPRTIHNTPEADFSELLEVYKQLGCIGIGELCANLSVSSPLYGNLFYHAGEAGLPVLFHLSPKEGGMYGMVDDPTLSGLEKALKQYPKTIFIGHAPSFWNTIDADIIEPEMRNSYHKGPIVNKGPLWRMMAEYSNLYGDFSAGSGYNALTRDTKSGIEFLKKFNLKIFYGTDMFFSKDTPPQHLTMMNNALSEEKITQEEYDNIMYCNFNRVFKK